MLFRTALIWMLVAATSWGAQYVVVVMDDSGSMADGLRRARMRKIEAAKSALEVVLQELPADSQVGVLALNNGWLIPLGPVDKNSISEHVNRLRASGGTPLGMRMKEATDTLIQARDEHTYGDYRLLVVTDGEASDQKVVDAILPDMMSRGLLVDVIGVDMESEHSLATAVHNYRRADDPDSLKTAIQESLAESDDGVDASESDFAIVAGLSPELSSQILSALTGANTTPIGGEEFDPHDLGSTGPTVPFPSSGRSGRGGGGLFSGIFCMMVVFFLVSTLSSVFRSAARRH